jgi:hypothetical protein
MKPSKDKAMRLEIIGEHPLAMNAAGKLKSRIGTIFVDSRVLITLPRLTHALQRLFFRDRLNTLRLQLGKNALTEEETDAVWETGVDLIMTDNDILIRPEPARMVLAFEADEILQELISKRHIRFLHVRNVKVQQAIRERGEYWRISAQPQKDHEIIRAIAQSKIAIGGRPLYYYNLTTGTRFLTVQAFDTLSSLETPDLRQHLIEIRDYSAMHNRAYHSELAFFATAESFGPKAFAGHDFENATSKQLRDWHAELAARFRAAVDPTLHSDSPSDPVWRNRMFACLTDERDETFSDSVISGLTPEFFRQVHWLPGGRVEDGELMFDPIFDELNAHPNDPELANLCDQRVKGFIFNYIREFGGLQFVNIGGLMPGLRKRPAMGGHRAYLAEVKHHGAEKPILRILRIQQWGIREHLNEGKDLLTSIMQAQDYTEYTLDRRLGCWELGMPLPVRIDTRAVPETYFWKTEAQSTSRIWATYYERDFVEGMATDKIPDARLQDEAYALCVAQLLGHAAAPNLVVGRTTTDGAVIFDSGDEMLMLDEQGMPQRIVVADHAGTFNDYESPLSRFAADYARPVLSRAHKVPNLIAFASAYLTAFAERLAEIQDDYSQKRRAYDTLFQHSKQGEKTFAWRWDKVLARLEKTDVTDLTDKIRDAIATGARA